ncbi:hypothetical protein CM1_02700 [Mycoplasmoides genitalium M6320]|uniref:Uncharacterized protein n=1 Tax=Mycoplasmoides genitalium M6320 TaxID=662945 RepID=A0ABC7ZKN3_MYCGT|nr:hypothetical protein CM3_02780 [Mycoplasmoides genitalium M6282]AFQ04281.1 hypothetical protein CM1_02700 [Mycoplasmoides genitalium M6320]AFQ04787.1 hypothetical protein CM5_02605 [Mycoplasmoides genitalium M2288]
MLIIFKDLNLVKTNNCQIIGWWKQLSLPQKTFLSFIPLFLVTSAFVLTGIVESLLTFGTIIEQIDKFTDQTNVMLLIYAVIYTFNPKSWLLKNQQFFLSALAYILFTFIGYNLILSIAGIAYKSTNPYKLTSSIFLHVIAPIAFFIASFIKIKHEKDVNINMFFKSLLLFMIYPLIYGLYLVTIPYVRHYLFNGRPSTYTIYGSITNTKDNPFAWLVVFAVLFIYFPLSYLAIYLLQLKLIKKAIKPQFNLPFTLNKWKQK